MLSVGLLISTALFLSFLGVRSLKSRLEYEFNLRHLALTRTFSHVSSQNLRTKQISSIQDFLDSLMADPDLEEAYLFSPQGAPLASKARSTSPLRDSPADSILFRKAMQQYTPQIQMFREKNVTYRVIYQRVWSEAGNGLETMGVAYLKFNYYRLSRQLEALSRELFGATDRKSTRLNS